MTRFIQTFADSWVVGVTYSAPTLLNEENDLICLASGNDTPAKIGFHNASGLTITYNGSPVEALELSPKALFIGSVKKGNITPLHGELKAIPKFPFTETAFHKISQSVAMTTEIPDTFDCLDYDKAQQRELKRINEAFKQIRTAKKLTKEQEEGI